MATKTELHTAVVAEVTTLLATTKVTKAFSESLMLILSNHLAPKSGGSANSPILDEEGNIVEAYCRFHKRYEIAENMVISQGKSKGYCKAGISAWNRNQSKVKALESEALAAMTKGNFEDAQAKSVEAKVLKDTLEYDYDADWASFKPSK